MPQFDITTFTSQIFWFAICFSILYYFVSKKILPRIRDIAKERQDVIDADLSAANASETEFNHLQNEIDSLRTNAAVKYQESLDQTSKNLAKQRGSAIESLKETIEKDIKKSQEEIKDFLVKSRERSSDLITNLTQEIKRKILTK